MLYTRFVRFIFSFPFPFFFYFVEACLRPGVKDFIAEDAAGNFSGEKERSGMCPLSRVSSLSSRERERVSFFAANAQRRLFN